MYLLPTTSLTLILLSCAMPSPKNLHHFRKLTRLFFFLLGYILPGLLLTLWFNRPTACAEEDVPVLEHQFYNDRGDT